MSTTSPLRLPSTYLGALPPRRPVGCPPPAPPMTAPPQLLRGRAGNNCRDARPARARVRACGDCQILPSGVAQHLPAFNVALWLMFSNASYLRRRVHPELMVAAALDDDVETEAKAISSALMMLRASRASRRRGSH